MFSSGGVPTGSTNFKTDSTLGQSSPLMDPSDPPLSSNYNLDPGFWYTIEIFSKIKDELAVDFDGDGKTDLSIFRSGGWFIIPSSTGSWYYAGFGAANDVPVPGDYDGDGKTDVAVFRPSNNYWYITPSSGGSPYVFGFGAANDVPVPGDYDGDGKTDAGVYRPATGLWLIIPSSGGPTIAAGWGGQANDIPVNPTAVRHMMY